MSAIRSSGSFRSPMLVQSLIRYRQNRQIKIKIFLIYILLTIKIPICSLRIQIKQKIMIAHFYKMNLNNISKINSKH